MIVILGVDFWLAVLSVTSGNDLNMNVSDDVDFCKKETRKLKWSCASYKTRLIHWKLHTYLKPSFFGARLI